MPPAPLGAEILFRLAGDSPLSPGDVWVRPDHGQAICLSGRANGRVLSVVVAPARCGRGRGRRRATGCRVPRG